MTISTFSRLLLLLTYLHYAFADSGWVGVNYGRLADNLPEPPKVVQLLKTRNLTRVKIFDSDNSVLTALSDSGISVVVALPNDLLSSAAANQSFTDAWINANILPYHPKTHFEAIAVGNEVFVDPKNTPFLLPAMKNIYASLVKNNINSTIKVSSPIALSALQTSYPSSSGSFKQELIEPVIKPMLQFLQQTNSYLMANVYPFFAYAANTDTISLDYALFNENKGVTDPNNGLLYKNLFDAQMDAVFAAMKAVNFDKMKIVVTETGWPSKGDEKEVGAGEKNAAAYNGNLVQKVLSGKGTPLKPDEPINVFLFALFNENQKPGPTSERNYGLFYPNEEKVYDIPLTTEDLSSWTPVALNGSKAQVESPPPASSKNGETWCVAKADVGQDTLQAGIDYACGEGEADCRPIQSGATCYDPNTLEAHASYAFNSYYQKNSRAIGTCDFGGAAYVVAQPPSFGNCEFPTRY